MSITGDVLHDLGLFLVVVAAVLLHHEFPVLPVHRGIPFPAGRVRRGGVQPEVTQLLSLSSFTNHAPFRNFNLLSPFHFRWRFLLSMSLVNIFFIISGFLLNFKEISRLMKSCCELHEPFDSEFRVLAVHSQLWLHGWRNTIGVVATNVPWRFI